MIPPLQMEVSELSQARAGASTAMPSCGNLESSEPAATLPPQAVPAILKMLKHFNTRWVVLGRSRLQHFERFDIEGIESHVWSTRCGWRFATGCFVRKKLEESLPLCAKCCKDESTLGSDDEC